MLNVTEIHPEYVTDMNGVKKSVILSLSDFYALLENLDDLAAIAERKDEPTMSHQQVVEELVLDSSLRSE
uniref:Prevent-host-death family protein n=1 Tax=Chlorobium chlorochromatii (strain CaD3) TaxID=340177 RepID=Q3APC1_CHLCH